MYAYSSYFQGERWHQIFFFRQMKFRFETALGSQDPASSIIASSVIRISGGPRAQKKNFVCGLIKFPGGDEETAGTGNAKTQTDGVKGV